MIKSFSAYQTCFGLSCLTEMEISAFFSRIKCNISRPKPSNSVRKSLHQQFLSKLQRQVKVWTSLSSGVLCNHKFLTCPPTGWCHNARNFYRTTQNPKEKHVGPEQASRQFIHDKLRRKTIFNENKAQQKSCEPFPSINLRLNAKTWVHSTMWDTWMLWCDQRLGFGLICLHYDSLGARIYIITRTLERLHGSIQVFRSTDFCNLDKCCIVYQTTSENTSSHQPLEKKRWKRPESRFRFVAKVMALKLSKPHSLYTHKACVIR